jgi:hypothetical protein
MISSATLYRLSGLALLVDTFGIPISYYVTPCKYVDPAI